MAVSVTRRSLTGYALSVFGAYLVVLAVTELLAR